MLLLWDVVQGGSAPWDRYPPDVDLGFVSSRAQFKYSAIFANTSLLGSRVQQVSETHACPLTMRCACVAA